MQLEVIGRDSKREDWQSTHIEYLNHYRVAKTALLEWSGWCPCLRDMTELSLFFLQMATCEYPAACPLRSHLLIGNHQRCSL